MIQPHLRLLLGGCVCLVAVSASAAAALGLHPDNRHYFLSRGQPTLIITSGEHYGAVPFEDDIALRIRRNVRHRSDSTVSAVP
jgi:hypothetical protein